MQRKVVARSQTRTFAVFVLTFASFSVFVPLQDAMAQRATSESSVAVKTLKHKSERLIDDYFLYLGKPAWTGTHFGKFDVVTFGTLGFRIDRKRETLRVELYVVSNDPNPLPQKDWPMARRNIATVYQALHDPRRGGMYDMAGGFMWNDPRSNNLELVRDFKPAEINESAWFTQLDRLIAVDDRWFHDWFRHFCAEVHGKEAFPTQRVTLESDPFSKP